MIEFKKGIEELLNVCAPMPQPHRHVPPLGTGRVALGCRRGPRRGRDLARAFGLSRRRRRRSAPSTLRMTTTTTRGPSSQKSSLCLGKIFSPYTGECFRNLGQTNVEHVVARPEAHYSGLCRADIAIRKEFASDLLSLTLASPATNSKKWSHDPAS